MALEKHMDATAEKARKALKTIFARAHLDTWDVFRLLGELLRSWVEASHINPARAAICMVAVLLEPSFLRDMLELGRKAQVKNE